MGAEPVSLPSPDEPASAAASTADASADDCGPDSTSDGEATATETDSTDEPDDGDLEAAETDASSPDSDESGQSCDSVFPIVGIGASAGGLESLERLFRRMPVDTGMAFVVIQHLSPDFKSLMDELLARYTEIPIHRAEDGMPVEPNCIYLIPPRKEMIISGRKLLLTDKDPQHSLTMPIDRFFRSLAQDAGRCAVGVILSGSGSDGSRGVRDIHDAGGLVLCESEETAKFDGMPLATLGTGDVDAVMAPEDIPAALVEHGTRLSNEPSAHESDGRHAPGGLEVVFRLLNESYDIDFSNYKPNTVGRRIQRRLSLNRGLSLDDYAEKLEADPDELNALYRDLLIGVTRFFRDGEAYERIERDIIPELVQKAAGEELRVWVAGCATGEEAYSLAMLFHERISQESRPPHVKIFATDVHKRSLEVASLGVFHKDSLAEVSPERLDRYFIQKSDGYHVGGDLRQMIVFAAHNVIKDAPFTKLDFISCRNLLIYFRPLAQKKAMSLFHFGLKAGGYLLLGPSETPAELRDEFDVVDAHWKLFRKSRDVRLPTDLRAPILTTSTAMLRPNPLPGLSPARRPPDPSLLGAYDAVLERYMPPSLLINDRRELLHAFAGAERYLRFRRGRPTNDVLDLLEGDLRTAAIGAVQRVLKDGHAVHYSGIRIETPQGEERLDVTVEQVANTRSRNTQLLIVLRNLEDARHVAAPAQETDGAARTDTGRMSRERIDSLELELRYSKENLQATIEELETSNEEMQATNEELVASNEELQSTNEELHSVNEELHTVNAEYQRKITELSELTADMDSLLASTDVGTVFLDRNLNVRKFTPQIGEAFHLLPQDIGRSIECFAPTIHHETLLDDLRQVLDSGEPCSREIRDRNGQSLFLRILPYRRKGRIEGVVLTLIDVTQLKEVERKLSDAVRLRDEFLAMLSHELRNPLGAILNATGLMAQLPFDNEPLQQACDVIRRQSRHLARLLDDLLDVSRVTQKKIELHRHPIDVAAFIRNAVDSVMPLMQSGELEFCEDFRGTKPLYVNGDAARLQQALSNLLANAAKYTPRKGHVLMSVSADENEVVIKVRDTGVGIPSDKLDSIFELFVQGQSTLHRSAGGMGIGLTLARLIVEMHDGRIVARSHGTGQGSEFEMRLPRLKSVAPPAAAVPVDDAATKTLPAGCRVVIIEDDDDNRNMLKQLLELQGCEVVTASNGAAGIAAVRDCRPNVALIDIGLPGLSGYEIARRIRGDLKNTETFLVAVSGYGQPSDIRKAKEAGFDEHLVKPMSPDRLKTILKVRGAKSTAEGDGAAKNRKD